MVLINEAGFKVQECPKQQILTEKVKEFLKSVKNLKEQEGNILPSELENQILYVFKDFNFLQVSALKTPESEEILLSSKRDERLNDEWRNWRNEESD